MMRSSVFYLLMFLALPFALAAQSGEWARFQPAGQDFSILFPGSPTVDQPVIDHDSNGASTSYLCKVNGSGFYYGAVLTAYTYTPNVDGELNADQNNLIKAVSGAVVTSSTRGTFVNGSEKLPDLTFTFDRQPTNQYGKSIVILRGNREYMWVAMITKNTMDASSIDTFMNSFQFTK